MIPRRACIGLGSNLGQPQRQLARALQAIARLPHLRISRISSFYRSAPVGCELPQGDYVNAAVLVTTSLPPHALLRELHGIERQQRRDRSDPMRRNAPRTLDLDVLLHGNRRIHSARLILPHSRMHLRAFVLRPLLEVAPTVIIPGKGLARRYLSGVRYQRIARLRNPIRR